MLTDLKLEQLLFIDIETVPSAPSLSELQPELQEFWAKKATQITSGECDPAAVFGKAGLFAEFGQIICVSIGVIKKQPDGKNGFRIKSYYGPDERVLLEELCEMFNSRLSGKNHILCGHNIKEFDIPFLCRRLLINDICIPALINCTGLKPWEVLHLDTMQLWKFGDSRGYASLDLLSALFKIPSPKGDISGADVARVYYEDQDLERISRYCQRDVLTVAQLLLRFKSMPLIEEVNVEWL